MDAAHSGTSPEQLARTFGFVDARGAHAAVERARDQIPAGHLGRDRRVELELLQPVSHAAAFGVDDNISIDHVDTILLLMDVESRLAEAAERSASESSVVWDRPAPGPVGGDRGSWTRGLADRANGSSFHKIADRYGLEDWFDAVVMIHEDLIAYQSAAASRLRLAQIAKIDHEVGDVYAQATDVGHADPRVIMRVARLLDRRARVRGLYRPADHRHPCPPWAIR